MESAQRGRDKARGKENAERERERERAPMEFATRDARISRQIIARVAS